MELPEIKVLPPGEPLFLLGTDLLVDTKHEWRFCYLGIHPETRVGTMVVTNTSGENRDIPLAYWPTALNSAGRRETLEEAKENAKPTKNVRWPPKRSQPEGNKRSHGKKPSTQRPTFTKEAA